MPLCIVEKQSQNMDVNMYNNSRIFQNLVYNLKFCTIIIIIFEL